MKKILTYALIAVAIIGIGAVTTIGVRAEVEKNGYPPMIEKFMERFDIDEGEAQEFFEQERQERQGMMQARFEERLDAAIAEGELTQEQKELILAKKEEMGIRMQEIRQEMQDWSDENDIDLKFLRPKGGGKGVSPRGGFRKGW